MKVNKTSSHEIRCKKKYPTSKLSKYIVYCVLCTWYTVNTQVQTNRDSLAAVDDDNDGDKKTMGAIV